MIRLMKKKISISAISGVVLLSGISASFFSCQLKGRGVSVPDFVTDSFVAHFDYFSYKGDDDFYKNNLMTEDPGFLTLKCADVTSTELKSPAFIGRRLQHHKFECTTSMYFKPQSDTEAAGLLLFKDERHQYFMAVGKTEGQIHISLKRIKAEGVEVLASQVVSDDENPLNLKISSNGKEFSFYFSPKNGKWKLLANKVDAYYLSTVQSYGFTGTVVGLYASKKAY